MKKNYNLSLKLFARRSIYFGIYILDNYILRKDTNTFILCYHGFSHDTWRYSIDEHMVRKQIDYLIKNHYVAISLLDIEQYFYNGKPLPKKSFVVTIDDGYKDVLKLKKYFNANGIKPTIFIVSEREQINRRELETNKDLLNKKEIQLLVSEGWLLGSHSATHPDFHTLSKKEMVHEIITSKKALEKEFSTKISYFAYPKGKYTDAVVAIVKKAGYTLGLSTNAGLISRSNNVSLLPRISIDRTYSFYEFKSIILPTSTQLRAKIVETFGAII